jgi:glycine amidinotransferase
MNDKRGHYRIDYEWATAREVVLGGTEAALPSPGTVFDTLIDDLYPDDETRDFIRSLQGRPMSEAHPDYHQRLVDETAELAAIFERHGVIVRRTNPYTDEALRILGDGGYCDIYAKDSFESVGHFHFELAHKKHIYRMFYLTVREHLQRAFIEDPEMRLMSFPQPFATHVNEGYGTGPFFEGGDLMVLPGNRVLIGKSGQASDEFGEEILSRFLETIGYETIVTRLHHNLLHLDCALALIGPDLVYYCPEAFLDGLPPVLAEVANKVETTLDQAMRLANNAVVIDANTVILDATLREAQGREIEAFGKNVEYIDFSAHNPLGGGLRCKTGVLARWDD